MHVESLKRLAEKISGKPSCLLSQAALEAAKSLEKLALNNNDNMLEFVHHDGPAAINKLVEKLPAVRAASKQHGKQAPLVMAPHTPRTDLESKRAQSESPNPET